MVFRGFLQLLRIVGLLGLILIIHEPDWVNANTPLDISAMSDEQAHWMMLGIPAAILGLEILSLLYAIFFTPTGVIRSEARPKVLKRYTPKSQWAKAINELNARDAGDTRGLHEPRFAVSRSAILKRVLIVLEDGDWNYYGKRTFSTLTIRSLEAYEQSIDEAKLALMHEYIIAMRQSGKAMVESQDAERIEMENQRIAEAAAQTSSNGSEAPAAIASAN